MDKTIVFLGLDNRLYGKGNNHTGLLGLGDIYFVENFTMLDSFPEIKSFDYSNSHIAAIDFNDNLWVCGRNNLGQLGLGDNIDRNVPFSIHVPGINKVVCGTQITVIVDSDNILYFTGFDVTSYKNFYLYENGENGQNGENGGNGENDQMYDDYFEREDEEVEDDEIEEGEIVDDEEIEEVEEVEEGDIVEAGQNEENEEAVQYIDRFRVLEGSPKSKYICVDNRGIYLLSEDGFFWGVGENFGTGRYFFNEKIQILDYSQIYEFIYVYGEQVQLIDRNGTFYHTVNRFDLEHMISFRSRDKRYKKCFFNENKTFLINEDDEVIEFANSPEPRRIVDLPGSNFSVLKCENIKIFDGYALYQDINGGLFTSSTGYMVSNNKLAEGNRVLAKSIGNDLQINLGYKTKRANY